MWNAVVYLVLGWMGSIATLSTVPILFFQSKAEKAAEVRQIDQEIDELKEMKRGFEGKALRAEDQAERMQFEDRFILETRRYFRIAEENRRKAKLAQDEIDRLEKRKAEILGS